MGQAASLFFAGQPCCRAVVNDFECFFEDTMPGSPGRAEIGTDEFLLGFWDSDLQSTRPRADTKPTEELRGWEKKQRAPLRYDMPHAYEHVLSASWIHTSEGL